MTVASLTGGTWVLLATSALLVGFSKTAIGGVAMVSVGICAAVLPPRQSTGFVLLPLLTGDVYAITAYRRHADWLVLRRLAPAVLVGIGLALLLLVAFHVLTRGRGRRPDAEPVGPSGPVTAGAGALAGFTSMVANAGGGVMTVYLLRAGMAVLTFLGTWFFFLVNLVKLPFSVGLGLVTVSSALAALMLVPAVVLGCWVGRRTVDHLRPLHRRHHGGRRRAARVTLASARCPHPPTTLEGW